MSIFNIFKKKDNDQIEEKDKKKEVIESIDKGVEVVQLLSEAYIDLKSLEEVKSISFKDVEDVGDAFKVLMPAIKAIYEEANNEGSGLYKLTTTVKDKIPLDIDSQEYSSTALQLASGKTVASINPYVLIVVVAVVTIQKEVEIIHSECNRILTFLKNDKESEIEGDISTLNDIVETYKYNWDNKEYCVNHHKLVLDIKRSAEHNSVFYQKQIDSMISDNKKDIASKSTEARLKEFENCFNYYQLSLYLYAYASYLELLLLGNFDKRYLDSVKAKLQSNIDNYQSHYVQTLEKLNLLANSSTESKALKGIGGLLQKVKKVNWISNTGTTLINVGNKQTLDAFEALQEPTSKVFIDKIDELSFLSSDEIETYFDKDNIIFVKK